MQIALIIIIVICIAMIIFDRLNIKAMNKQLKMIIEQKSYTTVKSISNNSDQTELIDYVNQLILTLDEMEANYVRLYNQNKQIISSIAHDFKTPLTSMLGYVQLLNAKDMDDKSGEYIDIIESRIKALNLLVEDFYLISTLESETYTLEQEIINPIQILQEQLAMYYNDLKVKFTVFDIQIQDINSEIVSNKQAYNRIYSNLIKNALVHGTSFFRVESIEKKDEIVITITNGVENNDIDINRLFDRTYQAKSNRNASTSGLGLSIVKGLSDLVNMEVSAQLLDESIEFKLVIKK